MAGFDDILEQALEWIAAGKGVVLASVVETWGSAPRQAGSMLAISSDSELAGSVSGGCVEGAVVAEALAALEDGAPRLLEYGVSDEASFAAGLACGGTIKVLVEPIGVGDGPSVELIEALVAKREARDPVAYLVNLQSWERRLADPDEADLAARFLAEKSGVEADWFVSIHNPPLRMIVVGAVHIAQPLLQMARLAGYDAVLVDPRSAFLTEARFPGERLVDDWPDEALRAEGIDGRTAVVTLSHDPKIDDPAIVEALKSEAFYLGCLGSRRTHGLRLERLAAAGVSEAELGKIHAPVGADIGANSPAEIAVAVMAEITERLRRPETRR
ncbi:MAG: XdhC/CoxI family protein [Paracoccaceae bacterium]